MPFYIIMILLVIIMGLVIGFVSSNLLIGYLPGMILGIVAVLAVVRKLGKKSQKSLLASTLFFKITRYRATIYNIKRESSNTATAIVYGDAHDYADLIEVLQQQMRFPASLAKDAARYVMEIAKDKPLQDKVRVALQYIDSGEKKVATGG